MSEFLWPSVLIFPDKNLAFPSFRFAKVRVESVLEILEKVN